MGMALSLARRGLGRVWPNPNVGCVIVKNGRVIGRGHTADGGRPHAETRALEGVNATGATVYVTLEPCAHHAKTPPCADALINAGVARVVVGTVDPDPRVAGKGIQGLREAGIEVTTGVREADVRASMAGYLLRHGENRPFVTLKLANSFDGRIATASGESKWITGPQARRVVHAMRARHDAVLVGAGTVRADDPALTVRGMGQTRQPVRVVVSRGLDMGAKTLLATLDQAPLWVCHGNGAPAADWHAKGAETIDCKITAGHVDPVDMMHNLASRGLTRVFCEGGGHLAASLLDAGLVDELIGFSAGVTLGADGLASVGAIKIESLADAPRFRVSETRAIGPDVMHRWVRA